CASITKDAYDEARREQRDWEDEVARLLQRVPLVVLPTLHERPSAVGADFLPNPLVYPWNLARTPAISIRVGSGPGESIQLVAALGGEELLLATAARIENSVANY